MQPVPCFHIAVGTPQDFVPLALSLVEDIEGAVALEVIGVAAYLDRSFESTEICTFSGLRQEP